MIFLLYATAKHLCIYRTHCLDGFESSERSELLVEHTRSSVGWLLLSLTCFTLHCYPNDCELSSFRGLLQLEWQLHVPLSVVIPSLLDVLPGLLQNIFWIFPFSLLYFHISFLPSCMSLSQILPFSLSLYFWPLLQVWYPHAFSSSSCNAASHEPGLFD